MGFRRQQCINLLAELLAHLWSQGIGLSVEMLFPAIMISVHPDVLRHRRQ
ncbi:Uncharacterised protein [Salmonella enterica subsp. enterica serovar Typhi]|nr:Uncharacterised protein [Salmonella enterica subsp. enterica serovar Typhi]